MNNLEIVLTILGMVIILIFLLNYKNSMEPFQNNFQSELTSKLTTLDDKIKILNEDSKDFSINKINSLNSHSCDLYQKVNQKNNNILDNEFKEKFNIDMDDEIKELKFLRDDLSKNPKTIIDVVPDLNKIIHCESYFYRKFAKTSNINKYWKILIKFSNK